MTDAEGIEPVHATGDPARIMVLRNKVSTAMGPLPSVPAVFQAVCVSRRGVMELFSPFSCVMGRVCDMFVRLCGCEFVRLCVVHLCICAFVHLCICALVRCALCVVRVPLLVLSSTLVPTWWWLWVMTRICSVRYGTRQ